MNRLVRIQGLISKYTSLKVKFDNYQKEIDNTYLHEDEVLVYQTEWCGDIVQVYDILNAVERLNFMKDKVLHKDENCDEYFLSEQDLKIHYKRLPDVDIGQLEINIEVVQEPDPYEDYCNDVTYLSFTGYVPWTEEQQEQQKKECKQKMAGLALDMHKVQEELLELGVDILGD